MAITGYLMEQVVISRKQTQHAGTQSCSCRHSIGHGSTCKYGATDHCCSENHIDPICAYLLYCLCQSAATWAFKLHLAGYLTGDRCLQLCPEGDPCAVPVPSSWGSGLRSQGHARLGAYGDPGAPGLNKRRRQSLRPWGPQPPPSTGTRPAAPPAPACLSSLPCSFRGRNACAPMSPSTNTSPSGAVWARAVRILLS